MAMTCLERPEDCLSYCSRKVSQTSALPWRSREVPRSQLQDFRDLFHQHPLQLLNWPFVFSF